MYIQDETHGHPSVIARHISTIKLRKGAGLFDAWLFGTMAVCGDGGGGVGMTPWMCFGLQPAVPIGRSPLTALPLDPFPP